jgi:hypothetical protein
MKTKIFQRTLSILLSALFLCATVPAQLALGPQRLSSVPAPTLRNRTRLSTGLSSGRPRISFVGAIGGVAFDGTARPARGVTVNNLTLDYSAARRDGERMSLAINNESVSAPIYDWQLVPIAKFADSDSYSCFTLFGDLDNASQQRRILANRGRILNYHPSFENTLMGLRLFQLDSLIINRYSWDLVTNGGVYLLGQGESAPNTEQNKSGLVAFWRQNPELGVKGAYQSYVISDNRRRIVFYVQDNELKLQEEPSYYFWRTDRSALSKEQIKATAAQIANELLAQVQALPNPDRDGEPWLRDQLIQEAQKYDDLIGNYRIIEALNQPQLLGLLLTKESTERARLLAQESLQSILDQLVLLKVLRRIQNAEEVTALSEKISNQTAALRAINPAVWDAGVTLMRYAAFFRYCKQNYPGQWSSFMRQIENAPQPRPIVITPTVMEEP